MILPQEGKRQIFQTSCEHAYLIGMLSKPFLLCFTLVQNKYFGSFEILANTCIKELVLVSGKPPKIELTEKQFRLFLKEKTSAVLISLSIKNSSLLQQRLWDDY